MGKNNYQFFTDNLNKIVQDKITMQRLIDDALEHNYFQLYYQPKVDLKTGKIVSCEALIRLIDPIKGLIPPIEFIPIAEENNAIVSIGKWVIEESTRQIKEWRESDLEDMRIAINISAKQFSDAAFLPLLEKETQDIESKNLEIELTETVLASDNDVLLNLFQAIKSMGIRLALDDFGTGYSSLSYLKNIPFDTIKIDKSFIDDITTDEKGKSFVEMIVKISETLELEIVAEGVERQEQRDILQNLHCHLYQGYLCSQPLPVREFELLVKGNS